MIFRQLFDTESSTYTYLIADLSTKHAMIIDPVIEHLDGYLNLLSDLDLTLKYTLDTHIHADHITASGLLRQRTDCESVMHQSAKLACVSHPIEDGESLGVGNIKITSLFTPGHTDHHTCYIVDDRLFTGDCLFINGCGRTDFQSGSAEAQWESVVNRLFKLPSDTLVYPGHDYTKKRVSTIKQERDLNPRFKDKSKTDFIDLMNNLNLPDPKRLMEAVPANEQCGLYEAKTV